MRFIVLLLATLQFGCATKSQKIASCKWSENSIRCVSFVRNYDADTVTVNISGVHPLFGKDISVRVAGVDSPEMKSSSLCERERAVLARNFVYNQLKGARTLDLVDVQRDKYFRILADIEYDGVSLKGELIRNEFAVPYDGGTKHKIDWCRK